MQFNKILPLEQMIICRNILIDCLNQLDDLDIHPCKEVDIYIRTVKGCHIYGQTEIRNGTFYIALNPTYVQYWIDKNDYTYIRNTLMHELLHCIEGCWNHGKTWQKYAERVNQIYGYQVSRLGTEQGLPEPTTKYVLRCNNCSTEWKFTRKTKVVNIALANPKNNGLGCPFCKQRKIIII